MRFDKKSKKSATVSTKNNPNYADNSEEKYFDYFVFTAWTTAYHARGLVIAHSRKLSATLGGSTSTRP
jgi:hypothetical protein